MATSSENLKTIESAWIVVLALVPAWRRTDFASGKAEAFGIMRHGPRSTDGFTIAN